MDQESWRRVPAEGSGPGTQGSQCCWDVPAPCVLPLSLCFEESVLLGSHNPGTSRLSVWVMGVVEFRPYVSSLSQCPFLPNGDMAAGSAVF